MKHCRLSPYILPELVGHTVLDLGYLLLIMRFVTSWGGDWGFPTVDRLTVHGMHVAFIRGGQAGLAGVGSNVWTVPQIT